MLESYADRMETIKLINSSYVKNDIGEMIKTDVMTEIEALVTNGKARATTSTGGVEFIDYLKVHYDTGELAKGDTVEIRGSKWNVATQPKKYRSHLRCEVVKIV